MGESNATVVDAAWQVASRRHIVDIEQHIAALPTETRALFERLFDVRGSVGRLVPPEHMWRWIAKYFGSVEAVSVQRVVKITNRWTLDGSLFNELRARRPLEARIPVVQHNKQPAGLLHGGASVVLAETLASVACYSTLDHAHQTCVGLEINANHLRGARQGYVTGRATPLHRGRSTQVWDIRLRDDEGRPTCISRCTMAVLALRP